MNKEIALYLESVSHGIDILSKKNEESLSVSDLIKLAILSIQIETLSKTFKGEK